MYRWICNWTPGKPFLNMNMSVIANQQIPPGAQDFIECAETTLTFFMWYQYFPNSELEDATGKQLYMQPCSIILHL